MSSGTNALKAFVEALKWEIEEAVPGSPSGALRTVLRAAESAIDACESADYEDYMREDM